MLEMTLTMIGRPTVLIEVAGLRFLTDPTFDAPGEYAGSVRLEKTVGPTLRAEEIGAVDAVLLSHDQHFDNLGKSGRAFLERVKTTFTTSAGARRLGGNASGLAPFETVTLSAPDGRQLFVTAAPARHGPVGIEPIAGDAIGFFIGYDTPGDLIYVTGDTVW